MTHSNHGPTSTNKQHIMMIMKNSRNVLLLLHITVYWHGNWAKWRSARGKSPTTLRQLTEGKKQLSMLGVRFDNRPSHGSGGPMIIQRSLPFFLIYQRLRKWPHSHPVDRNQTKHPKQMTRKFSWRLSFFSIFFCWPIHLSLDGNPFSFYLRSSPNSDLPSSTILSIILQ